MRRFWQYPALAVVLALTGLCLWMGADVSGQGAFADVQEKVLQTDGFLESGSGDNTQHQLPARVLGERHEHIVKRSAAVYRDQTAVDIADHHDGDVRRPRETHVRQIRCA